MVSIPAANAQGRFGLDDAANAAGYKTGNIQIPTILGAILNALFAFIAVLFFGLMIYAGYNWMTAMGEGEKVDKAKDTLITSSIGLVIILAAYAITYFVFGSLANVTVQSP